MKCCPGCGNDTFAYAIMKHNVKVKTPKPDLESVDEAIVDSDDPDDVMIVIQCENCGSKFSAHSVNDLSQLNDVKVKCAECGNEFDPIEIGDNGLCVACNMAKEYPEIADIIHGGNGEMLSYIAKLKTENEELKLNAKKNKDIEKAEVVEEKIVKKRGRPKKKDVEQEQVDIDNVEETEETNVTENPMPRPDIPEQLTQEVLGGEE